jgi:hypothetical protein
MMAVRMPTVTAPMMTIIMTTGVPTMTPTMAC